jgi:HAD superfamily hydrolase (TIGR01662 family)
MKTFEVLLFDLGGTLIYFDGYWPDVFAKSTQVLSRQLKGSGLDIDIDDFMEDFLSRLNDYFKQRERDFIELTTAHLLQTTLADWGYSQISTDFINTALKAMYSVSQAHWHPEQDTHETLHALREQGYRLALISNAADDNDVQTLVDKANIRAYFDLILSSAAIGIRKPNARVFTFALKQMESRNSKAVMVGDTLGADILGAQNAGITSIWITRRADNPANMALVDTIKADMNIATLKELPDMLKGK